MLIEMKKRIFFAAFVLIVSSLAAQRSALVSVDTLSMQVDTLVFHFTTYTPATDAGFAFMTTKPDTLNSNIGLCVVAAFTSKAPEHIVGTSVCNGKILYYPTESESGYCLITSSGVEINPLDTNDRSAITKAVREKGDYFQQMILVNRGKAVPTTIFRNRTTARRALVITASETMLVETDDRIHIDVFTDCLIRMGAIQAIYLDMGSWSEGWYRTSEGQICRIGKNWKSSHLQTNWLVIKKR